MGGDDNDEPLTPAGRLFLQPEMNQVVHCVVGLKNALDVDSIMTEIQNSVMLQHPRFTSLMVLDHRGVEHWRPTEIDLHRHVLVFDHPVSDAVDDQSAISDYIGDLCTTPKLSMDKPLWEIHLLKAHKCIIFRIHHSLGDGISLMSLLLASCRKHHDPGALPTVSIPTTKSRSSLWNLLTALFFSFIYVIQFMFRCLWIRDRKTAISGGDGVELWPRKIATASFSLEDLKTVKSAVPDAVKNSLPFYFTTYIDYPFKS